MNKARIKVKQGASPLILSVSMAHQKLYVRQVVIFGLSAIFHRLWRRLHNEELNDLYCSPNIVRVIKWRRMRWAGHVARMGEERGVYRVLVRETGGKETTGET